MNYDRWLSGLTDDEIAMAMRILAELPESEIPPGEGFSCQPGAPWGLVLVVKKGNSIYSHQQGCAVRQTETPDGDVFAFFKNGVQVEPTDRGNVL